MHERRARVRRLRIALGALAVAVLVGTGVLGAVATALSWDGLLAPGRSWDDRYTITSVEATGTLNDDGSLSVVEDFVVEWHEPRRGLTRRIDRSAPWGELRVSDIEVTSETQQDVWFEVLVDEPDGHHTVHLGEQHAFRPLGSDHYRITYDLDGMLVEVDGVATLRWDTFGLDWDTLIEEATVTLDLPEGDHALACVVGSEGQAFACDGEGPTWGAEQLRPGRGMTVQAQLAFGTVDPDALPPADLEELEEFSDLALRRIGLIAALTVAAAMPLIATFGTPRTRRRRQLARERVESTGTTYAPPPGMRPLTAGPLVAGELSGVKDDQLFAAWLLDAQQRDLLDVEPAGKGFRARLTGRGTPDSAQEAAALRALVPDAEQWATWDKKTPDSRAKAFEGAWQKLRAHHAEQAGVPHWVAARVGLGGGMLVLFALLVAVLLSSMMGRGAFVLVAGLVGAWSASTYTDRTLRTAVALLDGAQLDRWRYVEGLRRFVAEAHADQISGVADDPNVPITSPFLELLPWVIAFGHGELWAERFDPQIRRATEHRGVYAPVGARAVSQARSVSRPSSSSSGSGGGSGAGSGGGGGGGGSR